MHQYEIYGRTEAGHVRSHNEDHILVGRFFKNRGTMTLRLSEDDDYLAHHGLLLAVADGIGGSRGGEIASRLALTILDSHFYDAAITADPDASEMEVYEQTIRASIQQANTCVHEGGNQASDLPGMGCTLTGVCLTENGFVVFNVGDSRVYRVRDGALRLLTRDDTVAQERRELGQPATSQAEAERDNRTLLNVIGSSDCTIVVQPGPKLREQDLLMICSDGVHDLVAEETIGELLTDDGQPLDVLGQRLAQRALDNGGSDNLSLILLRVNATWSETFTSGHVATKPVLSVQLMPPSAPAPGAESG